MNQAAGQGDVQVEPQPEEARGADNDRWNPSAFHRASTAAAYAHAALDGMIEHEEAEPGRGKDVLPVTQADREDAVEKLQHAAGDGRLPLNERAGP